MDKILSKLSDLLKKLAVAIESLKKSQNPAILAQNQPIVDNLATPPPQAPEVPFQPSIEWGKYPEDKKMSLILEMKNICSQVGLTTQQTEDLIRTCWAESGLNPFCENPTTLDYGLCQLNIKWYLAPNKMTGQYAIDNPLVCVKIMANSFKAGRADDWIAHRNGNYLKCPTKYYK